MLKGKSLIKETNMLEKMQTQAMDSASQALDLYDVSDCISIAAHIKKEKKNKICSSFKIAPNVAMPYGSMSLIEFLLYMLCYIFLYTVILKCLIKKPKEHKFTAINIKSRPNEQNPETESNKKP
ncbi:hypothetical protein GQ457_12G029990 [Hibiscus cannabinus]